jgi:hypothetical protein
MYDMDEKEMPEPQIEAPMGLLPDLSLWGIEEVEPGVCEDSYVNRKLIRENQATWTMVYDTNGDPTNLIQVVTSEMKQRRLLTNKALLLVDQRDPDSDYITGERLVMETRADDMVPAWVTAASRKWLEIEDERERRGPQGKLFRPGVAGPPMRCRAKRMDGKRCQNWCGGLIINDGLCKTHISTKANADDNFGSNIVQKARNRLINASLRAVEGLEELAEGAESEPVRLNAYKTILDRGGIREGFEIEQKVDVTVVSAEQIVRDRLAEIAKRAGQRIELEAAISMSPEPTEENTEIIVDAVVVEEETEK